ncbi:MAG: hypothetical protein J6T65_06505 [Clostridia bacterium]|nr:hypothetical protein [Clostridia bacterium]
MAEYKNSIIRFNGEEKKCVVTFSGSHNVSLLTIKVDGKPVGLCALSSSCDGTDDAECPVDPVGKGEHEVSVELDGSASIHALNFTPESLYDGVEYQPTPESKLRNVHAETWEATDMLGRKVASVEDVGGVKDRKVGIFYWTWHERCTNSRPVDVTEVLEKFPAAEYNEKHRAWGERPFTCFWHEPFLGFYKDSDPYVIRHHMQMLADAGVDFLLFDTTNGALVWRSAYEPLFAEMHRMREDGVKTPQFAFMMNFWPHKNTEKMLRALYQNLYKPGLYSDLWFRIDGKPMVMCHPESIREKGVCDADDRILEEIKSFFAFRPGQPGYGCGPHNDKEWGWLEKFPQHKYGERPDGSCEMMTVGVAQNCNDEHICTHFNAKDTYGRSFTYKDRFSKLTKDSYKYGYNVQEQWERALDIGPDHIFITGWNEWIMGQYHEPWVLDPDSTQLAMVDQFDREHSRDIEPDKDGYLDSYYLQMASNIRRYKGAAKRIPASAPKTIDIYGPVSQWNDVLPEYLNDKGTTIHRDWDGFKGCHYVNKTGRNDIISAKVARDAENVYFLVECAENVTKPEGDNWMTLFIDADRSKATGWEGYDLVVNRSRTGRNTVLVEKYFPTAEKGSFTWVTAGEGSISRKGRFLTLSVPRKLLERANGTLDFEFKWSDNMQEHDVMDFYRNGDSAPLGRFNYLFKE